MKTSRLLCLIAALAVSGGVAADDGETPEGGPEPVPLFTNADLEKYGPSDAPDRPVADAVAAGDEDWTFVNQFIEGQYERIESEREHARELAEQEARFREPEWDGWSGRLLLAPRSPWWGYPWYDRPVHPTPYGKHGIKTPSNDALTGHSARAGRPITSGHYVSRRDRTGASRGGGHGHGSGGGGGRR
jgi:hypothetical protein